MQEQKQSSQTVTADTGLPVFKSSMPVGQLLDSSEISQCKLQRYSVTEAALQVRQAFPHEELIQLMSVN